MSPTQHERLRLSVGCDSHPADEVLSRAEIDNELAVLIWTYSDCHQSLRIIE